MKILFKVLLLLAFVGCQNNPAEKTLDSSKEIDQFAQRYFPNRDSIKTNPEAFKKDVDILTSKYKNSSDSLTKAKLNFFQAKYFDWKDQDSIGQIFLRKSLPVLELKEKQNYLMLIDGFCSQGQFFFNKEELNTSLKYYKQAVYYSEKYFTQDTLVAKYALPAFEGYGSVNRALENFDTAIKYLNKTIELGVKRNDTKRLITAYTNLSVVYIDIVKFETAIAFNRKAETLALKFHPEKLPLVYNHYAAIYYQNKDWENALFYVNKEYEVTPNVSEIIKAINLSGIYLNLNRIERAKPYVLYLEKEFLADKLDDYDRLSALERIPKYYIRIKDFKKADFYFDEFSKEQKYFYATEQLLANEDFVKKYDLKEKEDKIKLLNQKNELVHAELKQRNTTIFVGLLGVLLLLTVSFLLYFRQRNKKLKVDKKLLIMEDTLLRSQMEPHFVYNALSSLQGLIYENKNQLAVKYLSKFARLLRLSLEHSRMKFVPFSEEIESLESYLDLQKMRFGSKFSYSILGDAKSLENYAVPPLMVQPFVENAIYHGFATIDYEGKLEIQFEKHSTFICFSIKDNGLGIDASKNNTIKTRTSLSTTITMERLKTLFDHNEPMNFLEIKNNEDEKSGTIVLLKMPFMTTI